MNRKALRAMGIIPPSNLKPPKKERSHLEAVPKPKNDEEVGNNNNEKEEKKFDSDSVGTNNLSQENNVMSSEAAKKAIENSNPEPAKIEMNVPAPPDVDPNLTLVLAGLQKHLESTADAQQFVAEHLVSGTAVVQNSALTAQLYDLQVRAEQARASHDARMEELKLSHDARMEELKLDQKRFEHEVKRLAWEEEDRGFMNRHLIPAGKFVAAVLTVGGAAVGYDAITGS